MHNFILSWILVYVCYILFLSEGAVYLVHGVTTHNYRGEKGKQIAWKIDWKPKNYKEKYYSTLHKNSSATVQVSISWGKEK